MNAFPFFTRRTVLKSLAAAGAVAAAPRALHAASEARPLTRDEIVHYLGTLLKADGGYGWGDQELSHLTPTFHVIGAYRALGRTPPNQERLIEWVRTHHPRELKKLEQERRIFEWQQVQSLVWLGGEVSEFRPKIAKFKEPLGYLKQYEQHGYPIMQSELGVVLSHALLDLPTAEISEAFTRYIDARRRPNGSYNNTPAADGGDGHVMNTLWALQAQAVLGRPVVQKEELVAWLRSCQLAGAGMLAGGGFTFAPKPEFGGVDDIVYTRAAVRALKLLGAAPENRDACIRYIHTLANEDGGFGDRPGWLSNATATFYALDALDALGALDTLGSIKKRNQPRQIGAPPSGMRIFSIQIEAHGQGSPADAVELARSLKIDLWGAKNPRPGWIARAQQLAKEQKVPVTFFRANEEYGTWVNVPGMGTYSHTADIVAPPEGDIGAPLGQRSREPSPAVSWPVFCERRVTPLEKAGGRLVWQFGENEELVRMLLDDSVERRGFAAISTFHFGNPDFMNSEPFLNRWRGRIPFIALQDAHGTEPWFFSDQTSGFRTLFFSDRPTWSGFLNALARNWVVAVRHDVWTKGKTWIHSGSDMMLDHVKAREAEWRWWNAKDRARPMVSIVPVTPADEFETDRPERGTVLRVRCAWENTPQGVATKPISELVELRVDDRKVKPELVAKKFRNGNNYSEYCHRYAVPADTPKGRHTATAIVRVLATKTEQTRTIEFVV